jgi:transposase-like protein
MSHKGVQSIELCEQAARSQTDECILWPRCCDGNGYGMLRFRGKVRRASIVVCILAHGELPFEDAVAAHSCRNPGCHNPRHLRWATMAENMRDRDEHGFTARGCRTGKVRLTEEQVRFARTAMREGRSTVSALAREFGVNRGSLRHAVIGVTWRHVVDVAPITVSVHEPRGVPKLNEEQVREIRRLYASNHPLYKLSKQFNVTASCISAIVRNKTWRHVL